MNEFVNKLMIEFDEIAEKSATGHMTAIPIAHIKEIIKRVAYKQEAHNA